MKRSIWETTISLHSCPPWPCRYCDTGTLKLLPNTLAFDETIASKNEHSDEAWDPDWIDYTFIAVAECSNNNCKQKYSIAGNGGVEQAYIDDHEWDWFDFFVPKYCYPMPDLFTIPHKCPDNVKDALRMSFSLYLSDKSACAIKLRIALELLMDHLNIPSTKVDEKGKNVRISLHERIILYSNKEKQIGEILIALKWLGNTAAHDIDPIKRSDMLDAFEVFEHALNEILEQRTARIAKLAARLKADHAPN